LFLIEDAGDKKNDKLQQRLLAAYAFKLKMAVLKHAAREVVRGRPFHSHAAERVVDTSIQIDMQ